MAESTANAKAETTFPTVDIRTKDTTTATADGSVVPSDPNQIPWNEGKPILSLHATHDVTVRHFLPTDAPSIARHCNNPKLAINMRDRLPQPYGLKDAEEWINLNLDRDGANWQHSGPGTGEGKERKWTEGEKTPTNFVVCVDDVTIGVVGLVFGNDVGRRTAELGYWLGEEWWGQGIMTAVVQRFVDWTFETFEQITRLEAGVFAWNPKSCRVLEKCGFVEEGRHRCAIWKEGRAVDLRVWAKVRDGVEGVNEMPVLK